MKWKKVAIATIVVLTSACSQNSNSDLTQSNLDNEANSSTPEWAYLRQKAPGLIPEAFAPGLVSTEHWEGSGVFTPDLTEFYLRRSGGDYEDMVSTVFQYKDNQWQESIITPRMGQPFIAPDGKTMHLGKRYKERTDAGWSEIKNLGGAFEDIAIMRLTASSKGTYYFDEFTTEGDGVIRYSRLVDGEREAPRYVTGQINSGAWLAHPFIAPDESYILWDGQKEGGFGDADIYISFRQEDGSWGHAINLGDEINTDAWEAEARVTPDGKYLFFNRNMGSDSYENVDIFWVDAQVIDTLKDQNK